MARSKLGGSRFEGQELKAIATVKGDDGTRYRVSIRQVAKQNGELYRPKVCVDAFKKGSKQADFRLFSLGTEGECLLEALADGLSALKALKPAKSKATPKPTKAEIEAARAILAAAKVA